MSRKRCSGDRGGRARGVPLFEPLEARLLLDGNVTVFPVGGALYVFGDADANDILIEDGAPGLNITGRNGTTVNGTAAGTPVNFAAATAPVLAWLGEGNDLVEFNSTNVPGTALLDLGNGDATALLTTATFGGSVFVASGTGGLTLTAATAALTGTLYVHSLTGGLTADVSASAIDGGVTMYNGNGASDITIDPTTIGGDLNITNGAGDDKVTLSYVDVGGSASISNGAGAAQVTLTGTNVTGSLSISRGDGGDLTAYPGYASRTYMAASGTSTVGGNLNITNGAGDDLVFVDTTTVTGNVSIDNGADAADVSVANSNIGGSMTIKRGDGGDLPGAFAGWASRVYINPTTVGGSLTVTNGTGDDVVVLYPVTVGGNLSISNGADAAEVTIRDSSVAGSASISRGSGGDLPDHPGYASWVYFWDSTADGPVEVGGNLSITNGAGDDNLMFANLDIAGSVSVSNGADAAKVDISNTDVTGSLSISRGDGGDLPNDPGWAGWIDIDPTTVGTNATITNGTGDDYVSLNPVTVGGNVSIANGDDAGQVEVNDSTIGGSLSISRGDGGDLQSFPGRAGQIDIDPTTIGGNLTVSTGTGVDYIMLAESSTVGGSVSFSGGGGDDYVYLQDSQVTGNANVNTGLGNDTVDINSMTIFGSVTVTSPGGTLTLTIDPTTIDGNLSVDGRGFTNNVDIDDLTLGGSMLLNFAAGAMDVDVTNATIGGRLEMTGGATTAVGGAGPVAGTVEADFSDLQLNFGARFTFSPILAVTANIDPSVIGGDLIITTGNAADTVRIEQVDVGRNLVVNTGAGNDVLVIDDSNVAGATFIYTGPGWTGGTDDDTISIETADAAATASTFTGYFYLYAGWGDDTMTVGGPGANDMANFSTAVWDGGLGYDNLSYQNHGNTGTMIPVNWENQAPIINDQVMPNIDENSTNGTVVGTVTANDPDAGDTITYSITGGNTDNAFAINPNTGQITVNNETALDYETNPTFSLTVQVEDVAGMTASATVTINLNDLNEPPTIGDQSLPNIDENSTNGTVVGTVTADDVDAGDSLTYSITGGNTNNAFAINPNTGEVTVNNETALDYETNPTFNLTVQVEDTGTLTDTGTVTINLNDVAEP